MMDMDKGKGEDEGKGKGKGKGTSVLDIGDILMDDAEGTEGTEGTASPEEAAMQEILDMATDGASALAMLKDKGFKIVADTGGAAGSEDDATYEEPSDSELASDVFGFPGAMAARREKL